MGRRRIGKRITLSRPRIESRGDVTPDLTELVVPVFGLTGPDDFFPDDFRLTVETLVVDSEVAASVSTGTLAACAAVDDAVSAADCPDRAQPAASTIAEKTPASEVLVICRFRGKSAGGWVGGAILSPTLLEWATDRGPFLPRVG